MSHTMPRLSLAFSLFVTTQLACWAQKSNFRYFSVNEGLPQSSVHSMYQDRDGYLWFGTQGGVARYDGNRFITYNQKHGLSGNHVHTIFQDSRGDLWFGHRYEGVTRMSDGQF